jgi:hypothetical protein
MTQEETKNFLKIAQASKVVSPFTRALSPPFIGRRRDFYIPKVPLNPRNIPNVNTYMNVFYISYIYKPATSSHVKSGLLRQRLWLGFLVIPESLIRDPRISKIWTHRFAGLWFRGLAGPRSPGSRGFLTPSFRDFLSSDSRKNRISWNRSRIQIQGPCSAISSVSV